MSVVFGVAGNITSLGATIGLTKFPTSTGTAGETLVLSAPGVAGWAAGPASASTNALNTNGGPPINVSNATNNGVPEQVLKTSDGSHAIWVYEGQQASTTNSQNAAAVSIGATAGTTNQQGQAVAIGYQAGQTTQGVAAIAIGANAGQGTQNINAVAIGRNAGSLNQGLGAVAIGYLAGATRRDKTPWQ